MCVYVHEALCGCSCTNMEPCHLSRRKKNLSGRSWKKSWRRITARSPRLRPNWYALNRFFFFSARFTTHFGSFVSVLTFGSVVLLHTVKISVPDTTGTRQGGRLTFLSQLLRLDGTFKKPDHMNETVDTHSKVTEHNLKISH